MSVLVQPRSPKQLENRRYVARRTLELGAVLSGSGAEVTIRDLSATGMLIETSQELSIGDTLLIEIPESETTAAIVVWSSGRYFGCEFKLSIPAAAVSAALLRSPILVTASRDAVASGENPHLLQDGGPDCRLQDDRYPLRTRAAVIFGLAGLGWIFLGAAAFWIM